MSESTPETNESTRKAHLQSVPAEESSASAPAQSAPVRQSGGHFTGLLALLLAVAVFALLAQFSANQGLEAENVTLKAELATTQAELAASRENMSTARDALGGLKDVLARVESLLLPPVAAEGGAQAAPEAVSAGTPEALPAE